MSDFYDIITEILKDTKNESLIDTISLILSENNETFANICLEKSHETRYNEKNIDKILQNAQKRKKKKKWYKNPYLTISASEREILISKIREGEYFWTGEHTMEIRTADYCYFVELFGSIEYPEPQVLMKEELL